MILVDSKIVPKKIFHAYIEQMLFIHDAINVKVL